MGILADFLGGIGKGVSDTAKGVVNMLGSGVASARDLGAMIAGNYDPNNSEDLKWKKFMTGADNAKDAYAKSAGQALNAANNLSDVVIGLATGGAGNAALQGAGKILSKGAGAVATNALQGAVGGVADELQENGANASFDSGAQRAVTGGLSGFMSGLVNNKINNSSSKMLNNKFVNSNFGRGAISGAVGGATGGGMSTALNGGGLGDIIGNTLEGGVMGAAQGGVSGHLMGKVREAGNNMVNKIWTAEQNQSFQNAVNNPSKVTSPVYLGEVSQDTVNNIAQAYRNAGVDLNTDPDAIGAIKVENGKLYLTQDGAKHLNERRIQNDQMTPKEVRQTMRNATDNGVVSPNLSNAGNATMGAQNQSGNFDIAHIGVNEDGSLNLNTTYKSHGGKVVQGIKNTLGGSAIQPSTETLEGDGLPARTSALQGVDDNIPQNSQIVNATESHEGKNLRLKSAEALLDQYGTIDKPMARSANAIENVQKVADAGFTKPGEVEDIISKVTGANGKVSKLTQKLVNTAQPVDTVTDINRLVDEQIALNGLADTSEGKAVKNTIEAQLNRLESRRNGSITGLDNPEDVYDVVKALESRSADLKGKSGNNYRLTTPERTDQARVIDNIADVLKDRLYGGADMSKIMTPEVATELKSYAPKNQKWADYVDNTIMKSRDIGELRSTMAPFVNMGKVIENQYMNYGTYGSQMSQTAKNSRNLASKLSDVPVIGKIAAPLAEMTLNSNAADRTRAKLYNRLADQADQRALAKNSGTQGGSLPNGNMLGDGVQKPMTSLPVDDIGRLEGALVGNMVTNSNTGDETQYLEQMQRSEQNTQEKASPVFQIADGQMVDISQTEEAMAQALAQGDMASYNELGQIYQALSQAQENGVSGTVGTLDALRQENQVTNWLAQCQQAMMAAMQAGDYKAFTQYATMAESVQKLFGSSQKSPYEDWSSSDRKSLIEIQNGLNDIDNLESLYNQAGGGQGKLGGLIANIGSNVGMNDAVATYNTQMNSLGAAIVKNLINLGGTEYDAKRYVEALPQIDDSPEKAQQKLTALRSAYQKRLEVLRKMNG